VNNGCELFHVHTYNPFYRGRKIVLFRLRRGGAGGIGDCRLPIGRVICREKAKCKWRWTGESVLR
jgi:hypothetical protein